MEMTCHSFTAPESHSSSFTYHLPPPPPHHNISPYPSQGMAGGEIVVVPSPSASFEAEKATIIGNTCLYGATGGRLLVNGLAGERFAVRNSNAQAVVEGTGDHCCEYMTGGVVVALGR